MIGTRPWLAYSAIFDKPSNDQQQISDCHNSPSPIFWECGSIVRQRSVWSPHQTDHQTTLGTDHQTYISLHLHLYDCCTMSYLLAESEWLKRKTHTSVSKSIVGVIWSSHIIFETFKIFFFSRNIYKVVFVFLLGIHLKVLPSK